jgi:hypothetical protein
MGTAVTAVSSNESSIHGLRDLMRTLYGLRLRFEGAEFVTKLVDVIIHSISNRLRCFQCSVSQQHPISARQMPKESESADSNSPVQNQREHSAERDPPLGLPSVSSHQVSSHQEKLELLIAAEEAQLLDAVSRVVMFGLSEELLVDTVVKDTV